MVGNDIVKPVLQAESNGSSQHSYNHQVGEPVLQPPGRGNQSYNHQVGEPVLQPPGRGTGLTTTR
jgi:hypothetical protein